MNETPKYAKPLEKFLDEAGIDSMAKRMIITFAMIIHHDGWLEGYQKAGNLASQIIHEEWTVKK